MRPAANRTAWLASGLVALQLLATPTVAAYTVVMQTGARLEVREAPRFHLGRARVETLDGRTLVLLEGAVSASSTAVANRPRPTASSPKVWTNADLERLRGERVNVVGSDTTWAADRSDPAASAPASDARRADEQARWQQQARQLNQRAEALQAKVDALQRQDEQWSSFVLGTKGYEAVAARELSELRRQRAEAEDQLRQTRGEIELLQDHARRENVPPGWLR